MSTWPSRRMVLTFGSNVNALCRLDVNVLSFWSMEKSYDSLPKDLASKISTSARVASATWPSLVNTNLNHQVKSTRPKTFNSQHRFAPVANAGCVPEPQQQGCMKGNRRKCRGGGANINAQRKKEHLLTISWVNTNESRRSQQIFPQARGKYSSKLSIYEAQSTVVTDIAVWGNQLHPIRIRGGFLIRR
jgi:hypothetical protein